MAIGYVEVKEEEQLIRKDSQGGPVNIYELCHTGKSRHWGIVSELSFLNTTCTKYPDGSLS
jgi:hypothetical protein